jgi:hypothetical protein
LPQNYIVSASGNRFLGNDIEKGTILKFMTGKTVPIKSFGCQMNKLDTVMVKANNKNTGTLTQQVKRTIDICINHISLQGGFPYRVQSIPKPTRFQNNPNEFTCPLLELNHTFR